MSVELLLMRLIHVLCGTFWVGSGLFSTFFLAPALATSGVNAGQIFAALAQRKLFIAMPSAALLTIASGARLMWITSGGFATSYMTSATGRVLTLSGVAAVAAFVLALLIVRPAAVRSGELAAAAARAPEHERGRLASHAASVRRRGGIASTLVVTLLVLAAAGMSVARYV